MSEDVNVYRDGKVHVRAEQCGNCLFSSSRLVSGQAARDIVAESRDGNAGSFVCHRNQVSAEPEAICHAWWEAFADENWTLRLAKVMGIVELVGPQPIGE